MSDKEFTKITFKPVAAGHSAKVAIIRLNRPQVANAFHSQVVTEIQNHLEQIKVDKTCRALVIAAQGKNFCGGADIEWMRQFADVSLEQNKQEAATMQKMFCTLHELQIPTIALVQGAAYGGGVGLAACCDIVVATKDAKFALSEVKIGLIPAVILPFVVGRVSPHHLQRWMLTGNVMDAAEAYQYGLVNVVSNDYAEAESLVRKELNLLLQASPDAQARLKALKNKFQNLDRKDYDQLAVKEIAEIRTSASGQEGLRSFLNKQKPGWTCPELSNDWTFSND